MQPDFTFNKSLWMIFSFLLCGSAKRTLYTEVNPGWNPSEFGPSNTTNLVYTRSVGTIDTVHHLWSTQGAPSLLIALTSLNANLSINWTMLLINDTDKSGAIYFSEKPSYAFGLILTKLFQYSDPDDKGDMSENAADATVVELGENFLWQNVSETVKVDGNMHSSATFRTMLNRSTAFLEDGFLALQFDTRGEDGRSDSIPRLLFSENSTQLRLILNNVESSSETSRFAVEFAILTMQNKLASKSKPFNVETLRTMDDEYTPGVFKTIHVLSDGRKEPSFGGYASWKPVAYTTDMLTVTGSTNAVNYDLVDTELENLPFSVAKVFFQDPKNIEDDSGGAVFFNVSFGMTKDDYYLNSNYTEWTLSCGLGLPGKEELSTLVKIIIASGLGLPSLLMIASVVYLSYHKFKTQKDDLLLSRK